MSGELNRERRALVDLARFGLPQTVAGQPFPPSEVGAPLVVDTDAGGDPDDAVALVLAAAEPTLALVTTVDELGGERARFARHLLDLLGRADVPVVAGADLGNTRMNCVEGLVPDDVPAQGGDVVEAVAEVCARTDGPVRWVGIGPASNLARVLTTRSDLRARLVVTQMGGAINYRDPSRAEHNFRVDPAAAATLVSTAELPKLVLSDTTFTPEIEITEGSDLHRALAAGPAWARLVAAHLDRWFTRFHPGTIQHDALALAAALQLPYVDLFHERVLLDGIGRMTVDPAGHRVRVSGGANHPAFLRWLTRGLETALDREDTR
ncbi:Inosine-uridine preferring nucleoside hydrolase [Actinokineospora spheciospongiae]|uniref:Inosine-uridine preferring nucleoside hydrolase n=1 Tax=Actinokineospora spheciospongiae TaxID=909613 RepID=W7ISD8_9PSEU|nr:nucleoside hydrolase [Actinokineospora spheciospongiae]EWC63258.1 Inosine-uridine preferring nucleoside hydrolase [Actinokineospora spheciospongiae]